MGVGDQRGHGSETEVKGVRLCRRQEETERDSNTLPLRGLDCLTGIGAVRYDFGSFHNDVFARIWT